MQLSTRNLRRFIVFGIGVAFALAFWSGPASSATRQGRSGWGNGNQGQTSSTQDCDGTHHSDSGHGANQRGDYDNTCDLSPSGNGHGSNGGANGRPCAGCVGNADDKNPPGQYPNGPTDHNNGYECDQKGRSVDEGNNGVGFGNPAHTGCAGDTGGSGTTPPECPAGAAAMTAHSYTVNGVTFSDLTGNVHPGDTVVATFTIAAGCADKELSLVSYTAPGATYTPATADEQVLFQFANGTFGAGTHSLTVEIPPCFFDVNFVFGGVITQQGPAGSGNFYGDRLIDTDHGGDACTSGGSGGGGSGGSTGGGSTGGNTGGGNTGGGNTGGNTVPTVVPVTAAELANVGSAPADVLPAGVASNAIEAPGAAGSIAPDTASDTPVRGTAVKGVVLERGTSSAGLARTGLTLLPLAGLGAALCLVGVAMGSGKRRECEQYVVIADRLAGF